VVFEFSIFSTLPQKKDPAPKRLFFSPDPTRPAFPPLVGWPNRDVAVGTVKPAGRGEKKAAWPSGLFFRVLPLLPPLPSKSQAKTTFKAFPPPCKKKSSVQILTPPLPQILSKDDIWIFFQATTTFEFFPKQRRHLKLPPVPVPSPSTVFRVPKNQILPVVLLTLFIQRGGSISLHGHNFRVPKNQRLPVV
jgi:hypothetical protein